jgi:adenylate cyclase
VLLSEAETKYLRSLFIFNRSRIREIGGADDAIGAGIVKLEQLQKFSQSRKIDREIHLNIGIGTHVRDTMVGIIEYPNRMPADALSDGVNFAAHL